ncbi:LacI family DNA-binding transcriptional regulator [Paenibacillus sp. sgz500958]|uniref:LacI family DNA-binding transcriptional regulator n=1 Tax=Paenibacillus sp. sgz500958 TaxID=3242475 RepID=UPI0036D3049B
MDANEIARLAGVSRKTIQRVLNDPDNVRPETRDRIVRMMEEHHYEPSSAARGLVKRKANTIGLFIMQDERNYRLYPDDLFYGVVVGAIISHCTKRGYRTMVTIVDVSDIKPMMSMYRQKSIDGGLLISWTNVQPVVEMVKGAGFLIGVFDQNNVPGCVPDIPIPYLNNRKSAYEATRYIIEQGHTNIGIITGDLNNHAGSERLQGFLDAAGKYGIKVPEKLVFHGSFTEESGVEAIDYWVENDILPRAVFCSNDLTAYGAQRNLLQRNISVPERVALMGFDDLIVSQYIHPSLTTMHVPRVEMAMYLTDCLIDKIEGLEEIPNKQNIEFEAKVIIRESL